MTQRLSLSALSHPDYNLDIGRWQEYRLTFEGGDAFMRQYLIRLPDETNSEYDERRENTPLPMTAKDAVKDVRRSITQRLVDVSRSGGSPHYRSAVAGENSGIDREGRDMNMFMGERVLTDLLVMGRVGVYVDNIPPAGPSVADGVAEPYAYAYRVEDILNWDTVRPEQPGTFSMVLLRDHKVSFNNLFGINFPSVTKERYRMVWLGDDGFVRYRFLDTDFSPIQVEELGPGLAREEEGAIKTKLREVPFIMPALDGSLLADVAGYQRMLMNVASNEAMFAININSPMLTVNRDTRADAGAWKKPPGGEAEPGGQRSRNQTERQGIRSGWVRGRYYGIDEERPGWISAPVESLKASSDYRERCSDEVRALVNVAVQNQTGTRSESRETRELSSQGLESGLFYIASKLQLAERQIARYMSMYEGTTKPAVVSYPKRYSLKSDTERLAEAKVMTEVTDALPGQEVKKESAKQNIINLFTGRVTSETMDKMLEEVDTHPYIGDFDNIMLLRENALISDETAAGSQDLDKKEVDQGRKDRAEQIKITMEAQTPPGEAPGQSPNRPAARGAKELDTNKKSGKVERAEDSQKRGTQKAKKEND